MGSFRAELLKLRHRTAVRILGGVMVAIVVLLVYGLAYVVLKAPTTSQQLSATEKANLIHSLLPINFVATAVRNVAGLGGALALILGVLSIGSEYGWGTLKTIFTQHPSRLATYLGRVAALAVVTAAFTLLTFAASALCSLVVGAVEGQAGAWPDAGTILRALLAAWLITSFWAAFGMLLATWFQQSALAIGIGLVYSILFEGLVFGLLRGLSFIDQVRKIFPGEIANSLANGFRNTGVSAAAGVGQQPIVDAGQAALALLAYLVIFLGVAGIMLDRRDVA